MILIKRKRKLHFFLFIAAALFLVSFAFEHNRVRLFLKDPLYEFMEFDPGFSSIKTMFTTFSGRPFSDKVAKVGETVSQNIQGFPERPHLERIDLDIDFLAFQQILDDRKRAIKQDFLINPSTVKAKIRFHNKVYKTRVRLKGDLGDHWYSKTRMSLRLSLKGKKTIMGFKKFSLHKPRARQHPYDQTFQSLLHDAGNLSTPHEYAHVYVNGKYWGVMNIEEHISKEFLEKQQRKESIVVRLGNDKTFHLGHTNHLKGHYGYRLSDGRLNVRTYGEKKSLKKDIHRIWLTYLSKSLLKPQSTSYLDINSFSRALAAAAFWNNPHTLSPLNSRYYFNPYTLRLEPITTDQGKFNSIAEDDSYSPPIQIAKKMALYQDIVSTGEFQDNWAKNITTTARAFRSTQDRLDYFQHFFPLDQKINAYPVFENIKFISKNKIKPYQHKSNIQNRKIIDDNIAKKLPKHLHIKHYDSGKMEIYNLLPYPVTLNKILVSGINILREKITIPEYTNYEPKFIHTKIKGIRDNQVSFESEFKGNVRYSNISATLIDGELNNPLLSFPTKNDFLKQDSNTSWSIKPGRWQVKSPLIINGDLTIADGTELQFSDDSYLIVKGSLTAIGTTQYIKLGPINRSWKGVYVLEANKQSTLNKVKINNASALNDGLLALSGGVTFYKSDVSMFNVLISNSKAEDALNIVSSNFYLKRLNVSNSVSDGFDSDFSVGSIIDSKFSEIAGDAVDFSGSEVEITNFQATNIHDKAISAGESSTVIVKDSIINNSGVGIASKDGSKVNCANTTINDYQLYAAMTYVKKDFYGPPHFFAANCGPQDLSQYSRQKGSLMIINGDELEETQINIKQLYKSEIMSK